MILWPKKTKQHPILFREFVCCCWLITNAVLSLLLISLTLQSSPKPILGLKIIIKKKPPNIGILLKQLTFFSFYEVLDLSVNLQYRGCLTTTQAPIDIYYLWYEQLFLLPLNSIHIMKWVRLLEFKNGLGKSRQSSLCPSLFCIPLL